MARLRVLLVQRILPPYRVRLFEALATQSAFDIDFAFGAASSRSGLESVAAPSSLHVIPLRNHYFGRHEAITYQSGLASAIRCGQYDVIIAEFNPRIVTNVWACIRNRYRGRFIWWGHGMGYRGGSIAMRVRLWLAQLGDAVIFYDRRQAEPFASLGLQRDKIYIATNSLDVAEIRAFRGSAGLSERRNVLCIGRLIPSKRVDVLIRAYADARPLLPTDGKLVIVGDGPERAALTMLADQLEITDHVNFVGAIYDTQVLAPYFNTSWVSVCMGKVGLNAIHSLAFGLPMIAARDARHAPEIAALRSGETASFVDTADAEQLLTALVGLRHDPSNWSRMSEACVQLVDAEYSIEAMARTFEKAILAT